MINIDYVIERNESDELCTYSPNHIPKKLENVVYIQGPNSSGKSTLLNIIALAFFGNKLTESDIDPSLKDRINNLLDTSYQKIKFNITIDNPEMGLKLQSEKKDFDSNDIIVQKFTSDGVFPLSFESFSREFKLIYDIPHNPLERLPQLLNEIKITQLEIGHKISSLREYLWRLVDEIRNSQDPDLLYQLKIKKEKYIKEFTSNEGELNTYRLLQKKIFEYALVRFYTQYTNEAESLQKKIERLSKIVLKNNKDDGNLLNAKGEYEKELSKYIDIAEEYKNKAAINLSSLISREDRNQFTLWQSSNIQQEIFNPEVYETIRFGINFFKERLGDIEEIEKSNSVHDIASIELYKNLISLLSDRKFLNIQLPGINLSVQSFIATVSEELKKFESLNNMLLNINECKGNLLCLEQTIDKAITLRKNNPVQKSNINLGYSKIQTTKQEIKQLSQNLTVYNNKLSGLREKLVQSKIDPKDASKILIEKSLDEEIKVYQNFGEEKIFAILDNFSLKIKNLDDQKSKLKEAIKVKDKEISLHETKKPHKYYKHLANLEVTLQIIQRLEKRFLKEYSNYIDNLIKLEVKKGIANTEENKYVYLIGKYLALKMQKIKHIDTEYFIKDVNILEKKIITESNKTIRFLDLGTGQSQAAYLDAKLTLNEKKNIIALFDEVAMMDEETLRPLKEKLKQLYIDKKLFMSIVVQKNDTVKVESLI